MSTTIWWHHFIWILLAGGLGFAVAAIFAGWLQLPRRLFLIPYVALSGVFLAAYFVWSGTDFATLLEQGWVWGVVAGTLVGLLMVVNVRAQPTSRQASGGELALDLAWLGLAYGLVDALFLNVMPVLAAWNGLAVLGWTTSWGGKVASGAIALAASLAVTLAYHVGYPEFRNKRAGLVLIGNSLITLAYLVSSNPLGAIIAHVLMHLAAVVRGPETTIQLPPHLATSDR